MEIEINPDTWNEQIRALPGAHVLQTTHWAEVKSEVGWKSHLLKWKDEQGKLLAAANLLVRSFRPLGFGLTLKIGYIPRGPLMDWDDSALRTLVLSELETAARKMGLIFLKIDPEVEIGWGIPGSADDAGNPTGQQVVEQWSSRGWVHSREQIQFKNTALLDLRGSEEDWLQRMKQKTRYNLRVAQRSGVTVRIANNEDLPLLYALYAQTAARDGFIIREEQYYLQVWRKFMDAGMARALIAEVEGVSVAGLVLFQFARRAWYLYGMSGGQHREKMPNYLLQWEAMRQARSLGAEVYDLWGAPDNFDAADSMYGVFRFKDGLGAQVLRTPGAWDYPIRPFWCFIYDQVIPRFLSLTRLIRRRRLNQETK